MCSVTIQTAFIEMLPANTNTCELNGKSVFKRCGHFARPFKELSMQQSVKQPNKWVQKHSTRRFVWSAIVGFETFCFSLHSVYFRLAFFFQIIL